MIRETDLVSYLPPFLQEYEEQKSALNSENPEFSLLWKETDRTLNNHFISTADEYGISRYEKILGILPYAEDTLESRRSRVQSRWNKTIPYTMQSFSNRLALLCGEGGFSIVPDFSTYHMNIFVSLPLYGQVEELDDVISYMMPSNMVVSITNTLNYEQDATIYEAGGTVEAKEFTVTSLTEKTWELTGYVRNGAAIIETLERTIN